MLKNIPAIQPTQQVTPVFKPDQSFKPEKELQLQESLSLSRVIEKSPQGLKMFLNGSLTMMKYPFDAATGDVILAKVISQNPLNVSFTNILSGNISQQNIAALLSLLKMDLSDFNVKFLKILLQNKKPINKTRFEQFSEAFDKLEKTPDFLEMMLIMNVYAYGGSKLGEYLASRNNQETALSDVLRKLFETAVDIHRAGYRDINRLLEQYLLFTPAVLPSMLKQQKAVFRDEVLLMAVEAFQVCNPPYDVQDSINLLCKLIVQYLFYKSMYNRFGLYPDFLLLITPAGYSIIIYNSYLTRDSNDEEVISLGTQIGTDPANTISFKGLIYRDKLFIDLFAGKHFTPLLKKITPTINATVWNSFRLQTHTTLRVVTSANLSEDSFTGSIFRNIKIS